MVSYRVTPKKVQKVDAIPKGLTAQPKTSKQHPVVHNTRTGHAVMDAEFAKKSHDQKERWCDQEKVTL